MKTIMDDQPKSLVTGNLLPKLAENQSIVTNDQKYFCIHCKHPLYEPVQTECGHRLCRDCVTDIKQEGQSTKCPAGEEDCVDLSQSQTFSDKSMLKELRNLKVYCRYKPDGCTEQVKWGELGAHETSCSFGTVECPNKANGCTTRIPKAEIKQHVNNDCDYAKESCSQCKTIIMRRDMKEHERDSCPETIIPCENKGCTEKFPRKQLTQHMQQLCSKRQIKCPFAEAGCQFRGTVENVEKHLQDTKFKDSHLDKAMKTIGLLTNKNSELENKIAALESQNAVLERQVNNLTEDITEVKSELAYVGNTATIAKNKAFDYEKQVGHQNEAIVEIMDSKEELTRKFDVLEKDVRDLKTSQSVRSPDSTAGTGQVSLLENQMTLCNVRIAEMDLRVQCLETASYDGILLWKICDYKRRKAEAKNGKTLSLYSQPFYTSRFGYKMCARIYLNGDGMGKNTHLSLFFVVMRGEYDPLLQWPFQQRVTFSLLDQTPGSNKTLTDSFRPDPASTSFKRPTTDMNIASGCPMFVAQTVVDNAPYYNAKDDCIFIKVVVDPANLSLP